MCGIFGIIDSRICNINDYYSVLKFLKSILNCCEYRGKDNCRLLISQVSDLSSDLSFSESLFLRDFKSPSLIKLSDSFFKDFYSNFSNSGSEEKEFLFFGHLLHSVTGFVRQPLYSKNGIFMCNGEIYNWEDLAVNFSKSVKNDAELFFVLIEKCGFLKALELIDGDYAVSYFDSNSKKLFLARDILGVKPLFYVFEDGNLFFASERKALIGIGFSYNSVKELDPRSVLVYDLSSKSLSFIRREFFKCSDSSSVFSEFKFSIGNLDFEVISDDDEAVLDRLEVLLVDAVKKRVPSGQKLGVLFSGGIDSTILAVILKRLNVDFVCYSSVYRDGNVDLAKDLIYSELVAKMYDLKLNSFIVNQSLLKFMLPKVVELIESRDYIKVSVALPIFFSSFNASSNKCRVIFSGLGSEEIFAGYRRHKVAENVNQECLDGLRVLHKRDLYRDDVVTMYNSLELRVPFLDQKLVEFTLSINDKLKILKDGDEVIDKFILRLLAYKRFGIPKEFAFRKKMGAQYGSKFDKGLLRLAKDAGMSKLDFLNSLNVSVPEFKFGEK